MLTRSIGTALILSAAVMTLSGGGCATSGGGGGGKTFTAFSAVVDGENTEMAAEARVSDYTANLAGQVTSVGASRMTNATFTFALDNLGDFTNAELTLPLDPNISFDTTAGDTITPGALVDPVATGYYVAASASFDDLAVISDQNLMGFEYQSYGVWLNGINVGMGIVAAMSAGAATPALDVPVTGLALYNGSSTGFYVDPAGDAFLAFADFSAAVSFDTLAMNVASTNTQVLDVNSLATGANGALDFAGVGAVALDGSFSTAIAATDLAGTLDGRLYGPSAEELGGTFGMTGLNGSYIGAVGAAQ